MKDDLKIGLAASTIALGTYLAYRGISKTRLDLSQSNASVATENQDVPRINSHGDVSASPKKLPINEVSFDELPSIKRVRASICLQEPEEPAQSDYSDECTTARLLSELTEEIQEDIQNAEIEKLTSTRVAQHFGFFHRPPTTHKKLKKSVSRVCNPEICRPTRL